MTVFYAELLAMGFSKPKTLTDSLISVIDMFYKVAKPNLRDCLPKLALKRDILRNIRPEKRLDGQNLGQAVARTFEKILSPHEKDIFMPFVLEHFPTSGSAGSSGSGLRTQLSTSTSIDG